MELDASGAMAFWRKARPHLPQPKTEHQALVALHMARTESQAIPRDKRFWSHRWLTDNGYPSKLPDHMRPAAERKYPRKVEGVGIAIGLTRMPVPGLQTLGRAVRAAMGDAVEDCFAMGDREKHVVWPRMMEARAKMYADAGFNAEAFLESNRRARGEGRNAHES